MQDSDTIKYDINVPTVNDDNDQLQKKYYNNNINLGKLYNEKNIIKDTSFRIVTYNVHMWTGVPIYAYDWSDKFANNFDNIMNVILLLNPDILCLQEILYIPEMMKKIYEHYDLVTSCQIVPSYYKNKLYMTGIFIKKNTQMQYVNEFSKNNKSDICPNEQKCYFNQKSFMLNNDKNVINKEIKCFTKISFPHFDLINVHLSAYDSTGEIRVKELDIINEQISKNVPTIITGDFNMVNAKYLLEKSDYKNNYMEYINNIKKKFGITDIEYNHVINDLGWKDETSNSDDLCQEYTNWTGFKVDYIFTKYFNTDVIKKVGAFYNNASDHIPLIIDLSYDYLVNTIDNRTVKKSDPILSSKVYKINDDVSFTSLFKMIDNPITDYLEKKYSEVVISKYQYISQDKYEGNHYVDLETVLNDNNINDDTKILLFNTQPIDTLTWLDLKNMKNDNSVRLTYEKDFTDPYMTGTDINELSMGSRGIYLGFNLCAVFTFGKDVYNNAKNLKPNIYNDESRNDESGCLNKYTMLLYVFYITKYDLKMLYNNNQIIHVTNDKQFGNYMKVADEYDNNYDFTHVDINSGIFKVTRKSLVFDENNKTYVHKYLKLYSIFVVNYIDTTYDFDKKLHFINSDNEDQSTINIIQYLNKYNESLLSNIKKTTDNKIYDLFNNYNEWNIIAPHGTRNPHNKCAYWIKELSLHNQLGGKYKNKYLKYKKKYHMYKRYMLNI